MMVVLSTIPPGLVIAHTEARACLATDQEQATVSVARGSDGMEGSPPDRPADCRLLEHVASQNCALGNENAEVPVSATASTRVGTLTMPDVVTAILDRRVSCPQATSAALVRERDGDGVAVHLVLLDEAQQPLSARPGSVIAVTFAARDLGPGLRAAFADRQAIILR
jgi:hypothetical protein